MKLKNWVATAFLAVTVMMVSHVPAQAYQFTLLNKQSCVGLAKQFRLIAEGRNKGINGAQMADTVMDRVEAQKRQLQADYESIHALSLRMLDSVYMGRHLSPESFFDHYAPTCNK